MTADRYQANIITKNPTDPTSSLETGAAPGVWSLAEANQFKKQGVWPTAGNVAVETDEVFSTYMYTGNGVPQVIDNSLTLGQSYGSGGVEFYDGTNGTGNSNPAGLDFDSSSELAMNDFTVEAHVWITDGTSIMPFACIGSYANNLDIRLGAGTGNPISTYLITGSAVGAGTALSEGQWYHIAVVREGSALSHYVDGTRVYNATCSTTQLTAAAGSVGGIAAGSTTNAHRWMSNFRMSNVARYSGASITVPTANFTSDANTIILACQGTTPLIDESSYARTLTPKIQTGEEYVRESEFGSYNAASAGDGGLIWIKRRSLARSHILLDTDRGGNKRLRTDNDFAQDTQSYSASFNASGFSWNNTADNDVNASASTYASWAFKKATNFFTTVTYTGNGAARAISHDLGSDVGMLIVKALDNQTPWRVWMRGFSGTQRMELNTGDAIATTNTGWDGKTPTDAEFYVGADTNTNNNGTSYIAYIFAHNATGSFGPDQDLPMIKVGSYSGSGSIQDIDIGMEPSWIMLKNATSGSTNWEMGDVFRGLPQTSNTSQGFFLRANSDGAEFTNYSWGPLPNGFRMYNTGGGTNASGNTYYYMAIGRPTRKPTDASTVFEVQKNFLSEYSGAGFPVDMVIGRSSLQTDNWRNFNRMFGTQFIETNTTTASSHLPAGEVKWDSNRGFYQETDGTPNIWYQWRRAPHFFDMVWYKGTGSARTIPHALQQAPKMMWVRKLSGANNWKTYHASAGADYSMELNTTVALENNGNVLWNSTDPTDSVFSLGSVGDVNASGQSYICYLFGEVEGISKIGTLTGTGSDQTVDCGFTNGARWVMWKQTDATNSWGVTDVISGYTASSTNYFLLNSDAQRGSYSGLIKPDSSGFIFGSPFSSGSYIFYAIA